MLCPLPVKSNVFERVRSNNVATATWYVLQVSPGKEKFVKEIIDREFNNGIQTLVFTREITHKKGATRFPLISPLFPGYIFVEGRIHEVLNLLRKTLSDVFFKAVSFGNGPANVASDEMQLLLLHADTRGRFTMSYGFKEGEQVTISDGPLKNIQGNILFINEKKQKAKVKLTLFKKEMEIALGIELLIKNRRSNETER